MLVDDVAKYHDTPADVEVGVHECRHLIKMGTTCQGWNKGAAPHDNNGFYGTGKGLGYLASTLVSLSRFVPKNYKTIMLM